MATEGYKLELEKRALKVDEAFERIYKWHKEERRKEEAGKFCACAEVVWIPKTPVGLLRNLSFRVEQFWRIYRNSDPRYAYREKVN